ncbi:MAG: hypothetical protein LBH04_07460 [Tannerellaceae bacterium]|nr:hypothetical protein [Tannerellaceae bacterium]
MPYKTSTNAAPVSGRLPAPIMPSLDISRSPFPNIPHRPRPLLTLTEHLTNSSDGIPLTLVTMSH